MQSRGIRGEGSLPSCKTVYLVAMRGHEGSDAVAVREAHYAGQCSEAARQRIVRWCWPVGGNAVCARSTAGAEELSCLVELVCVSCRRTARSIGGLRGRVSPGAVAYCCMTVW